MIKTTCRIAITLGLIAVSVIWIAHGLKLIPDTTQAQLQSRLQVCESLAVTTSWFAERGTEDGLQSIVENVGQRSSDVTSIRIMKGGHEIASWGEHPADWSNERLNESTPERMSVDILVNNQHWGRVQVGYAPLVHRGGLKALMLVFFCGALVALLSWFFLNRALKYLNPSKVVPNRVRNALDVIAEGLVLQDNAGQIVMVNESFSQIVGKTLEELLGSSPEDIEWKLVDTPESAGNETTSAEMPWETTFRSHKARRGVMLGFTDEQGQERKFIVNSTPLLEENGKKCRGALTSFLDVSNLENKREELSRTLQILKCSRDEIRRQNENLQFLASRDSLTGCLNRRSFFERIEVMWKETEQDGLSVVMLDIDNFKSINDNYGHAAGDQVIKLAADKINELVGDDGMVCRYGGEEFCVALPTFSYGDALELAEQIRSVVEMADEANVNFTFSVGVSSREFLVMDSQHMVEQADQSMYVAKNNGKNQVVGWDECSRGAATVSDENPPTTIHGDTAGLMNPIDQNVLASLYSTLFYRDQRTALHSARVANLAATAARTAVDDSVVRVLEVSALLHDIGKVGIPDNVLNKPSSLEGYELHLMERRENVARAVCRSAGVSKDVASVVDNYHQHFQSGKGLAELSLVQPRLSFCCRILAICDAFDSMVNYSDYRDARTVEQAIRVLRECSPTQFDPELVELVASTIISQPDCLFPLEVEGANIDDSFLNETVDIVTAAEAGNLGPLRQLMKRLKREALGEDDRFQESIDQLELALEQNDEEIKGLVQTTRDLLEICRINTQRREEIDDFQPFE